MKKPWRIAGWLALVLVAVVGYSGYRIVWGKPFTINMLANRQTLEFLFQNPEAFTQVGIADGTVFDTYSGKLAPYGVTKRDTTTRRRGIPQGSARVRSCNLNRQDQVTTTYWLIYMRRRCRSSDSTGCRLMGCTRSVPCLACRWSCPASCRPPMSNQRQDRAQLRQAPGAMGDKLDSVTAEMQRQAKAGVVLPASLLERSLIVIHDTVAAEPEENALVTTFVARMNKVKMLDGARKKELEQKAVEALKTRVYPAYGRMSAGLEALKPLAPRRVPASLGCPRRRLLCAMLKQMTTTDYSPEKVHALVCRKWHASSRRWTRC